MIAFVLPRGRGRMRPLRVAGTLLIAASCCLTHTFADAQALGNSTQLTLGQSLLSDDGDLLSVTSVGLAFGTETKTQFLTFRLDTGVEKQEGQSLRERDPSASLAYGLEGRNTALQFGVQFREADLEDIAFSDPVDPTLITLEDATRRNVRYNLGLEFGRESPFGSTLDLSHAETRFLNTTSANFTDSDVTSLNLGLRFDVSRSVTARLVARSSETVRFGGTDLDRQSLGLGADIEWNDVLTSSLELGRVQLDQTPDGAARMRSEGGFAQASVTRVVSNGSWSGQYRSDLTENGRRNEFSVTRQLDLPRGRLRSMLGATSGGTDNDTHPIFDVFYQHELKDGTLGLSLRQQVSQDTNGSDVLSRIYQIDYSKEFNPRARLASTLSLRQSEISGGEESEQLDLRISYTQQLGNDWEAVGSLQHIRRGSGGNTNNELSFGLRRSFSWNR